MGESKSNGIEVTVTNANVDPVTKSSLIIISNRLPFILKRDPDTNSLKRHAR